MLVQPMKLVATQPNTLRYMAIRSLSSLNPFDFIIRKTNKIIYGSETPRIPVDRVRDQMISEGENRTFNLAISKLLYLREKSRKNFLRHNVRVRKLEDKIQNGVYKTKGLANKF